MNVSNYYVIDTYQYGSAWNKATPLCGTPNEIIEDINFLNPEQIVLCYKRSNTSVYNMINAGINKGISIIRPIDAAGNITGNVFMSPTGQWYHKFYHQIQLVIQNNILIP